MATSKSKTTAESDKSDMSVDMFVSATPYKLLRSDTPEGYEGWKQQNVRPPAEWAYVGPNYRLAFREGGYVCSLEAETDEDEEDDTPRIIWHDKDDKEPKEDDEQGADGDGLPGRGREPEEEEEEEEREEEPDVDPDKLVRIFKFPLTGGYYQSGRKRDRALREVGRAFRDMKIDEEKPGKAAEDVNEEKERSEIDNDEVAPGGSSQGK